MKIIRTANLTVLKTWLVGGQIDTSGNYSEGFHCLNKLDDEASLLVKDNKIDKDELRKTIDYLIIEYADDPSYNKKGFKHYDTYYRFKFPSPKNFSILINRIEKDLNSLKKET